MGLRHHYESHLMPSVWRTIENTMLKFTYNVGQFLRYTELDIYTYIYIYIYMCAAHTHTHTHTQTHTNAHKQVSPL